MLVLAVCPKMGDESDLGLTGSVAVDDRAPEAK